MVPKRLPLLTEVSRRWPERRKGGRSPRTQEGRFTRVSHRRKSNACFVHPYEFAPGINVHISCNDHGQANCASDPSPIGCKPGFEKRSKHIAVRERPGPSVQAYPERPTCRRVRSQPGRRPGCSAPSPSHLPLGKKTSDLITDGVKMRVPAMACKSRMPTGTCISLFRCKITPTACPPGPRPFQARRNASGEPITTVSSRFANTIALECVRIWPWFRCR
jgi:hypothetical protein